MAEEVLTCFVRVTAAHGIKVGDIVSSDPYCTVQSGSESQSFDFDETKFHKTEVISCTLNPKWNHEPFVLKPWKEGDELTFEVWDFDSVTEHDFLGRTKYVPTIAVDVKGNAGHSLPLHPKADDGKKHGIKGTLDFTVVLMKTSPTAEKDFVKTLKFSAS